MCLRPLYLIRECEHCDFLEDVRPYDNYTHKLVKVPCGKCIECVRKRQADLTVRIVTEAQNYHTMHFVTLTYDNASVPLACSLFCNDKDGVYLVQKARVLPETDYVRNLRLILASMDVDRNGRFLDAPLPMCQGLDGFPYFYRVAMSLNREHVKLWMKGCRTSYKRQFGRSLPDFKMAWCGEYGSRTARPHYHLLFLGLTDSQVHWMVDRWSYGFTLWKRCKTESHDKYAVARYISKYMSKESEFVANVVKWGLCQKPRTAVSRYLGYSDRLSRPFFFAYDLFGEYDPQTLILKETRRKLSASQLDALTLAISQRLSVFVPGCDYSLPIPIAWLHSVYYKKIKSDAKQAYRYVPFRIWKIVQENLLARDLADREREFISFARSRGDTPLPAVVLRFNASKASQVAAREISARKAEVGFYSSDAF